ncbi:MAG: phytanoyl-CoA dioxygenase family protein [Acidimicrobiales bacterium]
MWHRSVVEHFVRTLLGDPAVDVRLTAGGIHALGPGTDERTYWHQEAAVSADPWGPYMCAAWVALTDVPARRAPLIVVPRSHIDPTPTFGAGLRYGFDRFDQVRTVEDDENAFPSASRSKQVPATRCSSISGPFTPVVRTPTPFRESR